MRRIAAILFVLAACGAAIVLAGASDEGTKGKRYKVVFDNAFGLTEGGDLRIGGVKAGKTAKFGLFESRDDPIKAEVEVQITEPGFDLRSDATCEIRQQSLIGEYYVDCQPGSPDAKPLPENGLIPVERTASTIPQDLVNNVLRRPYRERLRLIIAELGTGLAGRPDDLAETIRRAHPGLRETIKTLDLLADQKQVIQDFITDSDQVVGELEQNKADVVRFVREAGETAEISASRGGDLRAQFQKLPRFLRELEPTMVSLERLADEQIPLLRTTQEAAPELNEFLTELGPFSQASRPAIRTLGDASVIGRRAFLRSREEIAELRKLGAEAPALGRPLRQLLQSLDDRRRSVEDDARAANTAPPAPDKNCIEAGRAQCAENLRTKHQGFTGMEAILNYFYWQTLAINGFDRISHYLRIVGIESEECSAYSVQPSQEVARDCNSYTGPVQPGLTEATGPIQEGENLGGCDPDPTDEGPSCEDHVEASRRADARGRRANKRAALEAYPKEERPRRGERDLSDPRPVLPEALRKILRDAPGPVRRRPRLPRAPAAPSLPRLPVPDTQLLDFLLGP